MRHHRDSCLGLASHLAVTRHGRQRRISTASHTVISSSLSLRGMCWRGEHASSHTPLHLLHRLSVGLPCGTSDTQLNRLIGPYMCGQVMGIREYACDRQVKNGHLHKRLERFHA